MVGSNVPVAAVGAARLDIDWCSHACNRKGQEEGEVEELHLGIVYVEIGNGFEAVSCLNLVEVCVGDGCGYDDEAAGNFGYGGGNITLLYTI